ncbi:MAG: 5'/3'-nucleotidase SurE [Chloroflexota bacterium]
MKILVTNDDGTASPGLWQLAAAMARVGETVVAAPSRDMSGSATAMMLARPASVRRLSTARRPGLAAAYSITAPPASCVLLALRGAIPGGPFDLVVSGINTGANMGRDALLSGTVGAAFIAAMESVPAIAISIIRNAERTWDWTTASEVAARLARRVRDEGRDPNLLLNVNLPGLPATEIKGARVTRLSQACCLSRLSVRPHETKAGTFRFRTERLVPRGEIEGSDEWAIAQGYISLTPLTPDLSYLGEVAQIKDWLDDLPPRL